MGEDLWDPRKMRGGAAKGVLSSWYSKWGTREGREGLQAAYLLFCGLAENHCLVFRYSEALEIFSSILISNSNIINPTIVKKYTLYDFCI